MRSKATMIVLAALLCFSVAEAQLVKPVISVTGSVIDEVTRKPISVNVIFFDSRGEKVGTSRSNAASGYYLVTSLKQGAKYRVRLESPEVFQSEYEIQLPTTDKYAEISRDFLVKPLVKDAKLRLAVSPFELRKSKIRTGASDPLDDIKKTLILNPGVQVEVRCFPDNDEGRETNLKLTEARCASIKDFLVKGGVPARRITVMASDSVDPDNPPPLRKAAKGKRYIGPTYIVVVKV